MRHFLLNILPLISGAILAVSYIPQIVETIKTKNVEGISKSFWILISIALTGLAISTGAVWYYTGAWGVFVKEFFNTALAVTMVVLVYKYTPKTKK